MLATNEVLVVDKNLLGKYGFDGAVLIQFLANPPEKYKDGNTVVIKHQELIDEIGFITVMKIKLTVKKLQEDNVLIVHDLGHRKKRAYELNWSELK